MRSKKTTIAPFEVAKFLASAGVATRVAAYQKGETIFSQGDEAESVMYIQDGVVKLTVLSKTGKEAVVAILAVGDFFGEGCLAGQKIRMGSATSIPPTTVLVIGKQHMVRMLHTQPALSDRFLSHVLARNIRIEQDLVDQLFNSSEKRLARALMLMARYGKAEKTHHTIPKLSQDVLADMVGTTRSRVNFFMNKFRKLGFIRYNGGLKINSSLLSVVLHE